MNINQTITNEAEARDFAIDWQSWVQERSDMSYMELTEWQARFEMLARKYPKLSDEFKENGIV